MHGYFIFALHTSLFGMNLLQKWESGFRDGFPLGHFVNYSSPVYFSALSFILCLILSPMTMAATRTKRPALPAEAYVTMADIFDVDAEEGNVL